MFERANMFLAGKKEYISLALLTIAIFPVFIWGVERHVGLNVVTDEMGYLASAAFFAGYDWSGIIHRFGFYSYGFALILTPLMLIFEDPTMMLQAGIVANAIFASLVFPLAYAFGKHIAPSTNRLVLIVCSLCVTLFHANIANTRILWAETLLVFLFWLICFCFVKMNKNSKTSVFILAGILLGYTFVVHQRTLAIVIAGIAVICLMKIANKITLKQFLIVICILGAIIATHELYMKPLLQSEIWVRGDDGIVLYQNMGAQSLIGNDFERVFERSTRILSISGILYLLRTFVGQIYAFGVTTFLLGFIGVGFISRKIITNVRDSVKDKNKPDILLYTYMFILLSFMLALAVSTVFMATPTRLDGVFYERYIYNLIGPIMLIALLKLFSMRTAIVKSTLTACIALFMGMTIIVYLATSGFEGGDWLGHITALGMHNFYRHGEGVNLFLAFIVATLPAIIIYIFLQQSMKFRIFIVALITIAFVSSGILLVMQSYIPISQRNAIYNQLPDIIDEKHNYMDVFATNEMRVDMLHIQFFHRDARIRLLRANESVEMSDYILFARVISANRAENHKIVDISYDMFVLKPIDTPHDTRYTYMFADPDAFFFYGFSTLEEYFRWSMDGRSVIFMSLDKYDYTIYVRHAGFLEQILEVRELDFSFYVNNHHLATLAGEYLRANNEIRLNVPESFVFDGLNEFVILYDSWSPAEYGAEDVRQLGLAVIGIEAIPASQN